MGQWYSFDCLGAGAGRSVAEVLSVYRTRVESRLKPRFVFAGVPWPPQSIKLVAIKASRQMELWAGSSEEMRFVRSYPIKGMSGEAGPKLREGDRQVPEGRYRIELLNPNSAYHLSLKLDYPNAFDLEMAARDGRRNLGGDIYIHGNRVSRGCLAMGDPVVEELFVLTALIGRENVEVLISPEDFRVKGVSSPGIHENDWRGQLYRDIAGEMRTLIPRSR